jgi:uncharacterized protein (TIGR00730 family)
MVASMPPQLPDTLQDELAAVFDQLPNVKHGKLIRQVLETILQMMGRETERLDWKILNSSLQDMEKGFRVFYPYRHTRKITIFGSARLAPEQPEYQMAQGFAQTIAQCGFMVMTGAGPGIMEAGNLGAGADQSFGLNIQLPFEQGSNPAIANDPKLINFKYFFTRKLFFLKESDAIALFPGGFGTQDEAFESLTLMQTGKAGPLPLVLVDRPGGDYWRTWDDYIRGQLMAQGLISPDDTSLYTITDNVEEACEAVTSFYRVFHSSRYVGEQLVLRLKYPPSDDLLDTLNTQFGDILSQGTIVRTEALSAERGDETEHLPRLMMHFNYRDLGRLHQMIRVINRFGIHSPETDHPEEK